MAYVYVGIGSNCERDHNIRSVFSALKNHFNQLTISSVYESESIGFEGDNFYNLVIGFETSLPIGELSHLLKMIEDQHGRARTQQHAFCNRTLDIDILLVDDMVGVIDNIELPRAEITENAFVLWPLSEIAGELFHPISHKTFAQLWNDYDKSKQKLKAIVFDY